jgi:hypothetical protein
MSALDHVAHVLIPSGRKGPIDIGWQDRVVSAEEVERHLAAGGNVGVIMGARSGHLVDIDFDCGEVLDLAPRYLPPTNARFGRASKPNSHWLYISPGATYTPFSDPLTGEMLVELRADGHNGGAHQTLFPPSVADGERREWHGDEIEPAAFGSRRLQRRVAYLAVGALIRRYVSPYASERPGPDMLQMLWEYDRDLARPAYQWLGQITPEQPRHYPKPRREMTALEAQLGEIVHAIPNDYDWNGWIAIGLAIYAVDGSEHGYVVFDDFSAKSPKYDRNETEARWNHFRRSPPKRTGLGKLAALARKHGWKPAAQERVA